MTVHVGTTVGRAERDTPRRRHAPAVAAARVVSVDYKPIVESAVVGLGHNTPDARREVYAQAKAVVKRHLQLMRLPDPIVELEKLALDLTIKGIEKRIRIHQSVEDAIREDMAKGDRRPGGLAEAMAALATALAELGRAFASLTIALCLSPVFRALWILLWPLRVVLPKLFSPVVLAATLPVAAMAVFVGFFVDDDTAYRSLTDGPGARWLSRLEEFAAVLKPRRSTTSGERLQAALEPPGDADAISPPSLAESPSHPLPASGGAGASPTSRGVTKLRPVHADFAAPPTAPAAIRADDNIEAPPPPDQASVCNDVRSAAERIICARAFDSDTPYLPFPASGGGSGSTQAPPQSDSKANPGTPSSRAPPERSEPGTRTTTAATSIETTAARSPTGPAAVESQAPAASIVAAPSVGPGSTLPSAEAAVMSPAPRETASETEPATASSSACGEGCREGAPTGANTAPDPAPASAAAPTPAAASAASDKVAALMNSARAAARAGDLDQAVRDFGEAIKLDAKYPDSYAERGVVLFRTGAIDRAIADFTAAIQRNGEHVSALRARGIAYFRRGSLDPALADINRAILLAGMKPGRLTPVALFEALRYRIAIFAVKQQFDLVIADATAIIDTYGRDPSLAAALKASYGEAAAGDAVAAVYRDRATAYVRAPALSLGWKRRLNLDRAVEDLSAAIPLSSDRGFAALLERAKLNEDLGQHNPAIADIKTALGIKPDSEEARSALRRLGINPPPQAAQAPAAAAAAPAIPMPRPRPALPLPTTG
jgi:tetratricopeptide (TPR) repeat protein